MPVYECVQTSAPLDIRGLTRCLIQGAQYNIAVHNEEMYDRLGD